MKTFNYSNHNDIIKTSGRYRNVYKGDLKTVQYKTIFKHLFDITGYKLGREFERLYQSHKGDKELEITLDEIVDLCKLDERKVRYIIDTSVMNPDKAKQLIYKTIGADKDE